MGVQLRYALVDGVMTIPFHDAKNHSVHGECPFCHGEVFSKCGDERIHHWAHKSGVECDKWWENKTGWHIDWQDQFPPQWRERRIESKVDKQWHIADIYTDYDVVLEFQHSHLDALEIEKREKFYSAHTREMLWVVDSMRLKGDAERFFNNYKKFSKVIPISQRVNFPIRYISQGDAKNIFPVNWLNGRQAIFFDFRGDLTQEKERNLLWLLIPRILNSQKCYFMFSMCREFFVYMMTNEAVYSGICKFVDSIIFPRKVSVMPAVYATRPRPGPSRRL